MASRLSTWGNALYTGDKVYPIVQRRKRWLTISTVLVVISLALLYFNGLNPGIEFRGGTEYVVANVGDVTTVIATDVITEKLPEEDPNVSVVGGDSIRVHVGQIAQDKVQGIADALAEAYNVPVEQVSSTFIGPTWGADVSAKAIQGLLTFILIVAIVIGLYFRAWRMAAAAVLALLHDLVFTAGIYALVGFEVTPATVIGFLTILGFSLYDTVVVFESSPKCDTLLG